MQPSSTHNTHNLYPAAVRRNSYPFSEPSGRTAETVYSGRAVETAYSGRAAETAYSNPLVIRVHEVSRPILTTTPPPSPRRGSPIVCPTPVRAIPPSNVERIGPNNNNFK